MDAKRNMAKEPQPREGGTRQMEGMDLESVIECARGHDAEALGEIYRRYVRRVFGATASTAWCNPCILMTVVAWGKVSWSPSATSASRAR